ncbi:hypothetical protein V499_09768 [Pseudogymnoascus sp. VKM F-103]|uniref:TBP-associated factor 6 n=1 Tax=Pseudogymnoascus verrucosus TaxID=342668 RepID=A0A1B8GL57_9PEZI|nr:uncharacterized protein VE01_05412 [Pseudogymnoascus verrucosus]KFY69789.1 hypothetical protein V499_09768 [Pseudogymnoascus sp. VKM F-103]OBT96526.1 hypothetical protein VE01_05412 [Pseudogymnoascus verrucosus]
MADQKLVWNADNVRDVAESVGISQLGEEAVRALSQEVEYRVGQVIVEATRFMQQGKRTVLGTQDISQALKVLDVEPLYGYESTRPLRFGEASLGPGQPLFYIEDEEVDFEKLINAPLPKVPRDISFTAHWLAVEGVQPSIPQNPTTAEARTQELVPKGANANPTLTALTGNDNVGFKPQVKHILSKELMLYFEKIRTAILDTDPDDDVVRLRVAALASVENDESLQQLVPYFVQFIAEKVTHNTKNIFVLQTMMELASALTRNERLFIDPYTTTLCSSVLTCLVGRGLTNATPVEVKDHYKLREFSASLLGHIAKKYAKSSQQLKPRLARTVLKYFLNPKKPLDQHYGAISGLVAVGGPESVRMLIIPNLKAYNSVLAKGQTESPLDAEMVVAALMKAIRTLEEDAAVLANGNGNGIEELSAQVEELVGPIIGGQISKLGDHKLEKAILECRS